MIHEQLRKAKVQTSGCSPLYTKYIIKTRQSINHFHQETLKFPAVDSALEAGPKRFTFSKIWSYSDVNIGLALGPWPKKELVSRDCQKPPYWWYRILESYCILFINVHAMLMFMFTRNGWSGARRELNFQMFNFHTILFCLWYSGQRVTNGWIRFRSIHAKN